MSQHDGHYTIEELLFLRDSPLVTKPDGLPQMEQWMQPAMERRNASSNHTQYDPSILSIKLTICSGNGDSSEVKYRPTDTRRSRMLILRENPN